MNTTVKNFLSYSFKGDGKYYITEQGSKSYKNTDYSNFARTNNKYIESVSDVQNDAPRGGKTGDFVEVVFTPEFKEIAARFEANRLADATRVQDAKEAKRLKIEATAALIPPMVESREETVARLSAALGEKIDANIFFGAVKLIRSRTNN